MKKGLSQILLVAAALGTTNAFTPATRSAAVAGVALERAAGFEVVAHGLVALMAFGAVWKSNFGRPTPSTRRAPVAASARLRGDATPSTITQLTGWFPHRSPKRADHLASTDDPIDECVAVLANGEEPDEEMLARCQDIARAEFANQATLEDENSY